SYSPWQYRCCQHNVAFGWPYFVESLWMATGDDGLAAVLYAPARVRATVGRGVSVDVEVQTGYPFDEAVEIALEPERATRFSLALRIPSWAKAPTVAVNRTPVALPPGVPGWVTLGRLWQPGDRVRLTLPMDVRFRRWERNAGAVSVERGPLTYSLAIPQRWERYNEDDRWPAFEVFPESAWNYGLDLKAPIEVARAGVPLADQPFTLEKAPVVLKARGRRIPQWRLEANGLVGALQPSPVLSTEPLEDLQLVPMGCARLRIAAFPEARAEGATAWQESAPLATGSSAGHFAPPSAMNDGRVGQSSGDLDVPRFRWADRYGTAEWAQYAFPRPREVSWVEVYWADEETARSSGRVPHDVRLTAPTDGRVRLPAWWRLVYWDGTAWQPAADTAEHGLARDGFNRVSFRPVVTTALRIEAQLRPRQSAGIVEWRVGP
ncbi:MAG TPA: transcriptional initiation protein Tat, partial [Vicinamibacteria bacterium]|nr:transcriptional initiation protein Tat [Vicinamibacteria bacterium]